MPLVNAKCTNCGATLTVDSTKDALICEHCGSAFIVEKAINNYNTINNIHAGTVNIYGGNSADFEITAGKLIKYHGASADVVIPNTVTIIGKEAFNKRNDLKSVIIPNSVTAIDEGAFEACSSLTSVSIPNSVKSIGQWSFHDCSSLTSVAIPDSVTFIGEGAFADCIELTSIFIPNSVTAIGETAFEGCSGLTSVTIPDSVTYIGDWAFSDCSSLTSVSFPGSTTTINMSTFSGCPITAVNASEEWKRTHFTYFMCLASYRPELKKTSGGCYIATCVYGSYDCPSVWTLRRFRDNTLDRTIFGRAFIKAYYATSPTLVRMFGKTKWFRAFWKGLLDKLVAHLNKNGVENTQYTDKY